MKLKKIKIGDIIRLNYANSQHDPKPTIVYMATVLANNGHRIVSGFNLNYIRSVKKQDLLIDLVRKTNDALKAYSIIKKSHPDLIKSFRTYIESDIRSAYRMDDKKIKLFKL